MTRELKIWLSVWVFVIGFAFILCYGAEPSREFAAQRDAALPHAHRSSIAHVKPAPVLPPEPPSMNALVVPPKGQVWEYFWQGSTNWTRHILSSPDMTNWTYAQGYQPSNGQQVFRFTNQYSGRMFYQRRDIPMFHVDLKK